ncbi:hypothetical protein C8J57DRAFT_1243617 [Mycena rebaudengoi]|nr:hypothetical protein C8J57DRAFT_1243617 [Mycena rebaudengoi]
MTAFPLKMLKKRRRWYLETLPASHKHILYYRSECRPRVSREFVAFPDPSTGLAVGILVHSQLQHYKRSRSEEDDTWRSSQKVISIYYIIGASVSPEPAENPLPYPTLDRLAVGILVHSQPQDFGIGRSAGELQLIMEEPTYLWSKSLSRLEAGRPAERFWIIGTGFHKNV